MRPPIAQSLRQVPPSPPLLPSHHEGLRTSQPLRKQLTPVPATIRTTVHAVTRATLASESNGSLTSSQPTLPAANPNGYAKLAASAVTLPSPIASSATDEMPDACVLAPPLPRSASPLQFPKRMPSDLQYEEGVVGGITDRTRPGPGEGSSVSAMEYLKRVLTSKVYDVAIESPLELAPRLSERLGVKVLLKREDLQRVFSFKLRGAYNMMAQLPPDALERGVICSSAGNHAQGVALAAAQLGCDAVIAMPSTTPAIKWKSVKRLGAKVVLVGDAYDETQVYAKQRALEEGRVFVPPFDHPDVIAGQGTVGMEILRQHSGPIHAIFVPVGGGGLIAGIAAYVKRLRPDIKVIGVEPADANAMALSLHEGRRITLEQVGGFADGVAVKMVGEETFRICRELVDGVVLVSRDAICAAIKDVFEETRCILEPAGALALAGAKAYSANHQVPAGSALVAITSGANMNFDRLRLVAELADVGERREAVLATSIPETPGTFKRFCRTLGPETNITEFKYRRANDSTAHVLYSVSMVGKDKLAELEQRLEEAGMPTLDMTNNDLAKMHLRHLVGGKVRVPDEAFYRFEFPEKPGALMKFLDFVSPRWDITLFHYRAQGEKQGNVLVGLQIPPLQKSQFTTAADALGYDYSDESNNEAFRMFMC